MTLGVRAQQMVELCQRARRSRAPTNYTGGVYGRARATRRPLGDEIHRHAGLAGLRTLPNLVARSRGLRTVKCVESTCQYRSPELADRIESLIAALAAGESSAVDDTVAYRFAVTETPADLG